MSLVSLAQFAYTSSYDYTYDSSPYSSSDAGIGAMFGVGFILFTLFLGIILYVFFALVLMKIFQKAGRQDSWAAWVPIYNAWVTFEIAGRPGWWVLMGLIPFVGGIILFVMQIIVYIDLAKSFGKGGGYAALLILVPIVGFPMLAWGDATYHGPAGPEGVATTGAPQPSVAPAAPVAPVTPAQPETPAQPVEPPKA